MVSLKDFMVIFCLVMCAITMIIYQLIARSSKIRLKEISESTLLAQHQ